MGHDLGTTKSTALGIQMISHAIEDYLKAIYELE